MMERVLVDTNIILDLLAQREEFYKDAQRLFTLADRKNVKLYISALSVANVNYILTKVQGKDTARRVLIQFKVLVEVLPFDDKITELALASDFTDFEDAIQYYTALENGLDIIVTRNKKDYKNVDLPILSAGEYINK